jgi:hypothetical protein
MEMSEKRYSKSRTNQKQCDGLKKQQTGRCENNVSGWESQFKKDSESPNKLDALR